MKYFLHKLWQPLLHLPVMCSSFDFSFNINMKGNQKHSYDSGQIVRLTGGACQFDVLLMELAAIIIYHFIIHRGYTMQKLQRI